MALYKIKKDCIIEILLKFEETQVSNLSRIIRKPTFRICENKETDQLRGNHSTDQRLCFCYIDSTIPLLPKPQAIFFGLTAWCVVPGRKPQRQISRVMTKPTFCICENKDADQLRGNREADQRLCFR